MPRERRSLYWFALSSRPPRSGRPCEVRMRVIGLTLMLVFVCASFPVAGQDQSTALVAASDVSAEQVVQKPAGPPPTPAHTGIKAMLKGLLTDFGNLPSKQNLFIAGVGG